jgi:hypothetical protein
VQKRGSLCAKERIFVYKLDSFVGFIGDEQLRALECYGLAGYWVYPNQI